MFDCVTHIRKTRPEHVLAAHGICAECNEYHCECAAYADPVGRRFYKLSHWRNGAPFVVPNELESMRESYREAGYKTPLSATQAGLVYESATREAPTRRPRVTTAHYPRPKAKPEDPRVVLRAAIPYDAEGGPRPARALSLALAHYAAYGGVSTPDAARRIGIHHGAVIAIMCGDRAKQIDIECADKWLRNADLLTCAGCGCHLCRAVRLTNAPESPC